MKDKKIYIEGAGGKDAGQSRAPIEQENTLQSRSTAKVVHVLSEGEIGGLVGVNPLQSVYFDQTPVEDANGEASFAGVYLDSRNGTPSQTPLSGFPELEDFTVVSTNVEDNNPVVRSIDANADAARTIVRLPQGLTRLDEETGDLNGYVVGVAVDTRLGTSGAWTEAFRKLIRGKTTSAYEEAYRIERPSGSGTWQVRVRRTTETSDSSRINDLLQFWAVVEITDLQIAYEDAAVVGLGIDSESTGGQIPTQSFLIDGIKLKVPSNYIPTQYDSNGDVVTYAYYDGTWNGATFKEAFCDDPAWVCYNMLINDRWGLGMDADMIDQYSFYEASQYNVELIDAYQDAPYQEPRFTFNGSISLREEPYKVIQAIAASCRGVVYANPGSIRFIQDRPQTPQFNITNANVAEGKFIYSSTPQENRITSVNVTFNDKKDRYLPKVINEQADASVLDRYGYNQLEIGAMGVVEETQARRLAKWALDTALNSNEAVEFTVGWENAFLDVGDVFNLSDNNYADIQFSGKVSSFSSDGSTVFLDREVILQGTETLLLVDVTGNIISKNIDWSETDAATDITEIHVQTPIDVTNFSENSEYIIQGQVFPRQFKVTSVQEAEGNGILTIQAARHDPNKYARVEDGIILPDPPTVIGGGDIDVPTNLTFEVESVLTPDDTIRFRLRMNWDEVDDPYLSHYLVRWRRNTGQYELSNKLTQSQFIIDNALPGYYQVLINAVNTRNVMSAALDGELVLDVEGQDSPLGPVSNLELEGTGGTQFSGTFFNSVWTEPAEEPDAVLKDYIVRLYDEFDNVMKIYVADTEFQTVTRDEVIIASGYDDAIRDVKVGVSARDTINRISPDEVTTTFTNPAPNAVTITGLTPQIGSYKVTHTESSENDAEGYIICHSTSTGFTPSRNNRQKDDVGNSHIIEAEEDQTYYVRVAGYDTWSRKVDELNFSAQDSVTTDFVQPDPPNPDDPIGVTPSSNITTLINGTQVANILITWNVVSGDDIVYDLEIKENGVLYSNPVVSNPDTGSVVSYQFNGVIGKQYCFRIRARRAGQVVSNWTAQECITQQPDSTSSSVPTGISATSLYQGALVNWTNPSEPNFSHTEVWRRQGSSGGGTVIADVSRPTSFFMDDGLDIGVNYQYRVRSVTFEGVKSNYSAWASVNASNVPGNSIVASSLAAGSVTANAIQANTITASELSTGELITTSAQIGDLVVTNAKLQNDIESDNFQTGTQGWRIRRDTGDAEFSDIVARGSMRTGISPAQRTEITADDPTYVMWIGSGTKNDSNGIFWVKTDGTSFISDQVFDVGGGIDGGGASGTGTASQSSNSASANTTINPVGSSVNINVDFSFSATVFKQDGTVEGCPFSSYSVGGTMFVERSSDGSSWSSVGSKSFDFNGACQFLDNSNEPGLDNAYRIINSFDVAKSFVDNSVTSGTNYYRVTFSSWSSYFLSGQVSSNTISISATG